jgi:adenine-specific DNA-methyltransferase
MPSKRAETYRHEEEALLRPDVGTQAQFRKRKPPKAYRYDSSLSPALDWDDQPARALGDWLLAQIDEASRLDPPHRFPAPRSEGGIEIEGLEDAVAELKKISRPFLDWAGKAERLSFDVPTLPLFVHERLSTKAILETLAGHERDRQMEMQLFADPQLPLHQQLEAYEHKGGWVNRLILGDSLVVMNSLLEYEGLGGQVQMIYIDPPYGVKFGSNFQPFVRRRDIKDGADDSMTREPEMVKAYRDTWELGLHSYLTYLRDRLLVARELLTPSGSVFVQISDENVHHVRELMDDVLGAENFCALITFRKTQGQSSDLPPAVNDFLIWYSRARESVKFKRLFVERDPFENPYERYICVETPEGKIIDLSVAQKLRREPLPAGRILKLNDLTSQTGGESSRFPVAVGEKTFTPSAHRGWSTNEAGIERMRAQERLHVVGSSLMWKAYRDEFPFRAVTADWPDAKLTGFGDPRYYVVQTAGRVIARCVLMTTDPGDLVLDPTCGSGTTAYVAEQWGRRWITIDTSRVPLALARQRLLTATFPYYDLKDADRGPAGGFVYKRRQNKKGEEVGGIVPHVTLKRSRTTSRRPRRCSSTGRRWTRRSRASPAPSWSRRRSRHRSTSTATARRTREPPPTLRTSTA